MRYKYITEDNLQNRQDYMYSEYGGKDFLKEYVATRKAFIEQEIAVKEAAFHITYDELQMLKSRLEMGEWENYTEIKALADAYVRNLEVRKRLHSEYDGSWRPVDNAGYENYELYLLLAQCLVLMWERTVCTKYVSCLLKVNDTMLSISERMTKRQRHVLAGILKNELRIFEAIAAKAGVSAEEYL